MDTNAIQIVGELLLHDGGHSLTIQSGSAHSTPSVKSLSSLGRSTNISSLVMATLLHHRESLCQMAPYGRS